jgi:hypothetical protein
MTKKDFVALAEALRIHNRTADGRTEFTPDHLRVLADFCASQDPNFNPKRWVDYIAGECAQAGEFIFLEACGTRVPGPEASQQIVKESSRAFRPNSIKREIKAR